MSGLVGNPEDRFSRVAAQIRQEVDDNLASLQENWSSGFPIRSDTNRPVQSQKNRSSWNFRLKKKRNCTICAAKTKMLISCAVYTAQLICVFVFA